MKFLQAGLLILTVLLSGAQAAPVRAAVFNFELDDTSLEGAMKGTDAAEQARLAKLDVQLGDVLKRSGKYILVDMAQVAAQARATDLQACDACAISLAHKVGAQVAITGWVQKVSNLILNINLEIRDVATGRIVQGGSVDIRGDTDESWSRGLAFLMPRLHLTTDRQLAR